MCGTLLSRTSPTVPFWLYRLQVLGNKFAGVMILEGSGTDPAGILSEQVHRKASTPDGIQRDASRGVSEHFEESLTRRVETLNEVCYTVKEVPGRKSFARRHFR